MIQVHVNGKPKQLPAGLTVTDLLERLELQPATVVVELNQEILERDGLSDTPVREGDRVELVHFVGGG